MTVTAKPVRLPVTDRDAAGLRWFRTRLSYWACSLRRRRKKLRPGPLSPDETMALNHLVAAERAVEFLLDAPKTLSDRRPQ